ncbi:MAG: imidazole glycerol phosphate synthase subunit HisF [Rhodospirillaceae bacterium]|nr:imidazole glycerol phosphate synthase subunit HisF [Rhodospirillaceae bacterium]|tara:strand:+ start:2786 stop:3556 length:771 start_codon:yes stop_codon:yes gene_type:complete
MKTPNIRIIPKLEVKGLNVIKGIRMEGLRKVGLPEELSEKYYLDSADEILFIDSVASLYGRNNLHDLVTKVSEKIKLPLCVGGGVKSKEEAKKLFRSGADKISLNTQAITTPSIINELATVFGTQSIVISIQAKKKQNGFWEAYYNNGREKSNKDVIDWLQEAVDLGAGEILLTSIDQDGTKLGPDFELIKKVLEIAKVPVIVSGGIRNYKDIIKLVDLGVRAVAIGHILHFNLDRIVLIKKELLKHDIPTRLVIK